MIILTAARAITLLIQGGNGGTMFESKGVTGDSAIGQRILEAAQGLSSTIRGSVAILKNHERYTHLGLETKHRALAHLRAISAPQARDS